MSRSSLSTALEDYTSSRVVDGNRIDVLLNGEQIFPAMLEAIGSARRTITFAQYFYGEGPIARDLARALAERCRAGIGVKVLLDAFGSRNIPTEHVERMQLAGCHVVFFRPLGRLLTANYRNHRRILVIDGRLGFTGGAGVGRKWMGSGRVEDHWRDTDVRVEGPVVEHLQRAFADSWLETTGMVLDGPAYYPRPYETRGEVSAQVVTSAPAAGQFAIYTMFLLAISSAQRSVYITNPYFLPDSTLVDALIQAVSRGVRVAVLAPGPIDYNLVRHLSRANFGRLLQEGVEIYEYNPALLHAKTMIVDSVWATVGSANLDNRSFAINSELNLVVYGADFARRLERVFEDDLRYSRKVDYQHWTSRGLASRLLELIASPLRDLL